ncbi:MAG: EAL domain-containing protein [Methylococcales bacterium]
MEYQSNIDEFHTYLNTVLTELLENQVRTRSFITGVQQYKEQVVESRLSEFGDDDRRDWEALSNSNSQLLKLGTISWERSIDQIKNLLVECDHLIRQLHKAMIDRALYEQQGLVLQGIILSHEKVQNWEEFVRSILCKFHDIFEFNFFSIAFDTRDGIDLYLYYMGEFPIETMAEAKIELSTRMTSKLSRTKVLIIKEYQVIDKKLDNIHMDQMHSVTLDVHGEQENLGGLLEMGYFSSVPLGIDEESIIRSILSVMVMVIGSSRTLKKTITELNYQANQDPLTGLYNRRYFNSFLENEIERSNRHNHEFCMLMMDLDDFKGINDLYGHLCGDDVLRNVAQILKKKIRRGDMVTRLGGDEFCIILPETSISGALYVAEEIRRAIEENQFSGKYDFQITTSIGLISYPTRATSMTELMSCVDMALYQAKTDGQNIVRDYDSSMSRVKSSRRFIGLSQDLTCAMKEQRIIPYFQPIVTTEGQTVHAYQALARLVNEKGKIISAGKFIDAAERSGVSTEFDKYMIQRVTDTLLAIFETAKDYPLVFINLSPISLQNQDILRYASSVCVKKGIPVDRIVFEIKEREMAHDMIGMKQFLGELRNQGFAFALDDFGSGYNSFLYLRDLYFEYVKIDGEFVRNMLQNKADNALIESLYGLCEKLDMKTIAECVEDDEILTRLQEVGVTYCQGFHTGMPSAKMSH